VITVSGKGSGRFSIAGLVCLKPGARGRLMYRTIVHRARKGERRSFAETDYIALIDTAHQQPKAPIVLIWNLNIHVSAVMRALIAARDWLTVIRLPAYAPDLIVAARSRRPGAAGPGGPDELFVRMVRAAPPADLPGEQSGWHPHQVRRGPVDSHRGPAREAGKWLV